MSIEFCRLSKPHLKSKSFFHNFFISYYFLKSLEERNIKATGTFQENRAKHCPVIPCKEMRKMVRSIFDCRLVTDVISCVGAMIDL